MTGRERLVAAARGGETDRQPQLSLQGGEGDAVVVPDADSVMADAERAVLVEVNNPVGQALDRGEDPRAAVVDQMVEASRGALRDALDAGADGVVYRVFGSAESVYDAYEMHDRTLLEEVADARLNVLYAAGAFDPTRLRDLPAHVFAWDADATGVSSDEVRAARAGAQASTDSRSEIRLV